MNSLASSKQIGKLLRNIPKVWDGRKSVLEMRKGGSRHWRQMEWIGFYFQFLCEKHLKGAMEMPGPKYGNAEFDGFTNIPWDFKAHAINTSSHQIIVNDSEATAAAIDEYGEVGIILALGEVMYNDENRTFQKWHEILKGGKSKYVAERIKRGAWSRLRKTSFDLQQISFIKLTDRVLVECGSFQEGFRNADGTPRRSKVLIDLEKVDNALAYVANFH